MKTISLFVLTSILVGCSTPYQSSGFFGGFDEIQLSEDSYQVSYAGNRYTSNQQAIDYTLLRSAEIAIANGYKYFIVIDSENRVSTSLRTTPGSLNVASSTKVINTPSTTNTIRLINEEVEGILNYDANITAMSIKTKYGLLDEIDD